MSKLKSMTFQWKASFFKLGVIPRRIDIITKIDGMTDEEADKDKITVEVEGLMVPVISLVSYEEENCNRQRKG